MTDVQEILDDEIEDIKDRDEVKAVGLVGSYARDLEGEHNDIDIYVIVEEDWRKRVNKEIEGILFEEFFNSMEWAKSYFDRSNSPYYMFHWMKNIDVRHDPEGLFEELQDYAEERREEILELDDEDRQNIYYKIWDFKQDIDHSDVGQRRHTMNRFFDYLVEKNYILEQETPVKQNHRIEKLQDFDGYMYKLAQDYLTSSSTLERKEKLEKMAKHVKDKVGEFSVEFETDREEYES